MLLKQELHFFASKTGGQFATEQGVTYLRNIHVEKLEVFLAFLKTINRWHKLEPIESVIAEKDREIDRLNAKIEMLEA